MPLDEGILTLSDRKISTYVNALAKAGFVIEQMIERSDDEIIQACDDNNDFARKAKMLPVNFVIKARKLLENIRNIVCSLAIAHFSFITHR